MAAPQPQPQTFTFTQVGSLSIKLDIYLTPSPAADAPILLWFHGGGLIQGCRARYGPHTVASVPKYGHVPLSPDYRLAPQATLAEILADALDALNGPEGSPLTTSQPQPRGSQ
ncbi:hypothetical protein A1O3_04624 [Capronia epimyces CBS 606.96]|uniref:BD-FAE-like domain-containing protein n=1 Tax=Capronia epimyces CBS 606.96 TaxID=1182542 RepID=W9XTU0_9EURO|nr:uncharacterized protein A1O3_04624 [Capronia epimyces CBS 606.96]EXJ83957.1 hypothetical protein A1O3_04624 [Capronia epimyces CBS 606.96]